MPVSDEAVNVPARLAAVAVAPTLLDSVVAMLPDSVVDAVVPSAVEVGRTVLSTMIPLVPAPPTTVGT